MFGYYKSGGCGPRGYYAVWGHGRHGWSGHWGRHGGGRRSRVFDSGELRLVLLKLIADEPRHGYDLIRAIEELTGGGYAPSPGVVYPTLTLLDDMGLIEEAKSEGAKKQFAVTEAGTAYLADRQEEVDALIARLTEMGRERAKADAAPIRRAMGNLREVLRNRLSEDEIDLDALHRIAAVLDEAAQKIERMD